jgi:hypothetical protein
LHHSSIFWIFLAVALRHEEKKRAIQPILPLLLLERKCDMPPPPSFPQLKHGKSTDLKHKRQQNEREQNFKNPGRNKKPRTAKKEKKNKHEDYSGSKKRNKNKSKGNRHTRRKKLGN